MPFKRQAKLIANKQKRDKTVNTLICIENSFPSAAIYSTCCTLKKSYKYFKLSVIPESENEFNASKAALAIIASARSVN